MRQDVRVDQGAAYRRGHCMDGRNALSAAAFCLSLRGESRVESIRDVQIDGAPVTKSNHQPGNDRDLARRALSRLVGSLALGRLVTCETGAGVGSIGYPRFFRSFGEGFCCRPEFQEPTILSNYQ